MPPVVTKEERDMLLDGLPTARRMPSGLAIVLLIAAIELVIAAAMLGWYRSYECPPSIQFPVF